MSSLWLDRTTDFPTLTHSWSSPSFSPSWSTQRDFSQLTPRWWLHHVTRRMVHTVAELGAVNSIFRQYTFDTKLDIKVGFEVDLTVAQTFSQNPPEQTAADPPRQV